MTFYGSFSYGLTVCFILSVLAIVANVAGQLLFARRNEPPVVFHWIPVLGSTLEYGLDPEQFFHRCRAKYGDVFTFILLGKKTTVCLGIEGNDFVLNAKQTHANAEEVYRSLTEPVFGSGVVYAIPHAKMMEQKKFLKFGLTTERLKSYVPLLIEQVQDYVKRASELQGLQGSIDVASTMGNITIFTASRTLQGKEARQNFDGSFADLYHDLDMGFVPINFIAPSLPTPANRRRDAAQQRISGIFVDIINQRRLNNPECINEEASSDMIHNLMHCRYKDGTAPLDTDIAHMLVALLMAGQHSSASIGSWMLLRLASRPEIQDALVAEQSHLLQRSERRDWQTRDDIRLSVLLTYDNLTHNLPLHTAVIRETLRLHAPIHSIMRAVKLPLHISTRDPVSGEERHMTIPPGHVLLSAPGVTAQSDEFFTCPFDWDPWRWMEGTAGMSSSPWSAALDNAELSSNMHDAPKSVIEDDVEGKHKVSKGTKSPYLPFGAGRHRCIGEAFAHLQLSTILALLVHEFQFAYPSGASLPKTDYSSLFSKPKSPAELTWTKR